jgi:two-component system response regulator RegA
MNARDEAAVLPLNLLLVDGSERMRGTLAAEMKKRGYRVTACCTVHDALRAAESSPPDIVLTELKLPDDCGLAFVSKMKRVAPQASVVVLTSYASVATAVEAIKRGAADYLIKPSTTEQIIHALSRHGTEPYPVSAASKALSIDRLKWEYINWVLLEHAGNLSAAARALSMHRRTLQRKLSKRPRGL